MRCRKALSLIQAYFDGELDPGDHERILEHLKGCPSCSGELERLRSLSAAVKGLEAPGVTPSVWEGYSAEVLRKARSATGRKIPVRERQRAFTFPRARLAYAAAAIFLVFAGGIVYHFTAGRRQPIGDGASLKARRRPVVERFEAGDPGYSVMSFEPETSPVAVVWIFGYRIESAGEEEEETFL